MYNAIAVINSVTAVVEARNDLIDAVEAVAAEKMKVADLHGFIETMVRRTILLNDQFSDFDKESMRITLGALRVYGSGVIPEKRLEEMIAPHITDGE